jgi:PIN domain nuclease of toxin-antitoxin system
VKYLLDTHVWLWAVLGDHRLSRRARGIVSSLGRSRAVGLAAISLKEAAWHLAHGRVRVESGSWQNWLREASSVPGLDILPLTTEVAIRSEELSTEFPHDPADRLIAATALVHGSVLVTADRILRASPEIETAW